MTSAQGTDFSAYQAPIAPADLAGLDFAFTKATEGLTITDPDFGDNWTALGAAAGLHRGAYHEYRPDADPLAQAQHFVSAVKAHGLRPGDILALVASDYPGITDAAFKAACDWTTVLAGPACPVLAYTDLDIARTLVRTSQAYDLWVAWPSPVAPVPAQWAPARWATWRFWQWGQPGGVDHNAFNGSRADLDAWVAGYSHRTIPPVPGQPSWQEEMMNALPVLKQGATGSAVRTIQALCTAREHPIPVDGVFGPVTAAAVKAVQAGHGIPADGIVGPQTWPVLIQDLAPRASPGHTMTAPGPGGSVSRVPMNSKRPSPGAPRSMTTRESQLRFITVLASDVIRTLSMPSRSQANTEYCTAYPYLFIRACMRRSRFGSRMS